ncbi:hypothetical protein OROGR_002108 [Orobanche gracilis]
MRINPKNHKFFRIVLWTKSAFDIKKSEIPPLVPDLPPFGIHGFNPVRVSQGDENHVISHNHIIQKGVFDQNKFRGNIIKPQIHDQLVTYWPNLERGSSFVEFINREAWKHNTNRTLFPEYTQFITKGLNVGSHYIDRIVNWMTHRGFHFDNFTQYNCQHYKTALEGFLSFEPDLRFYKLPHRPGVLGLRKIGILGVVTVLTNGIRQFNPVRFQLDKVNLWNDEKNFTQDPRFLLETLRSSVIARQHLLNAPGQKKEQQSNKQKKPDVGESSAAKSRKKEQQSNKGKKPDLGESSAARRRKKEQQSNKGKKPDLGESCEARRRKKEQQSNKRKKPDADESSAAKRRKKGVR